MYQEKTEKQLILPMILTTVHAVVTLCSKVGLWKHSTSSPDPTYSSHWWEKKIRGPYRVDVSSQKMNKQTLALLQKSESSERIFKISLRMCSKVAGVFFSPTLGMVGIDLICISARFELPERLHSVTTENRLHPVERFFCAEFPP